MGIFGVVQMEGQVSDHAAGHKRVADVIAQQGDLLVPVQLDGECDFDFARELGVAGAARSRLKTIVCNAFSEPDSRYRPDCLAAEIQIH